MERREEKREAEKRKKIRRRKNFSQTFHLPQIFNQAPKD